MPISAWVWQWKRASGWNGSWNICQGDFLPTLDQGPWDGPCLKKSLDSKIILFGNMTSVKICKILIPFQNSEGCQSKFWSGPGRKSLSRSLLFGAGLAEVAPWSSGNFRPLSPAERWPGEPLSCPPRKFPPLSCRKITDAAHLVPTSRSWWQPSLDWNLLRSPFSPCSCFSHELILLKVDLLHSTWHLHSKLTVVQLDFKIFVVRFIECNNKIRIEVILIF